MPEITRVVLFKHGVGYFERRGRVRGDQEIELGFKAGQMNDVLKSLITLDLSGGTFGALSYDAEEPGEKRLEELNIDIPQGRAFTAFLDGLKGARLEVEHSGRLVQGHIVGTETWERLHDGAKTTSHQLVLLAAEGRLLRLPLDEISGARLLDGAVRRDLDRLLQAHFAGLHRDRKLLRIQCRGEGERQVQLGYVVEAPVWKTSYRVVLPAGGQRPLLQGWAIVDNTTEDDWHDISLSLVSGLPISFVHDLYSARYRQRPVVEVEREAAVAPPVVEGAMLLDEMAEAEEMDEEMEYTLAEGGAPLPSRMRRARGAPPPAPPAELARQSVRVETRTEQVGDLFAYNITTSVSIDAGHSAMVPILQESPAMERVAIYNPEVREKNPLSAFRLENDTGLTLEGGPVTVFEGDQYVGEAMLETMRRQEKRITPYSVELAVTVQREEVSERQDFHRAVKRGRYIHRLYRLLQHTRYQFHSRLERPLACYLDHRFSYAVRENTPEPEEVTENFWRFKVELEPRASTGFTVTEVSEESESIEIPGIARRTIRDLVDGRLISRSARKALEQVAELAEQMEKLRQELAELERREKKIVVDQKRLRENLRGLGSSSEEQRLRSRYVKKLEQQEEQLEQLRGQAAELRQRLEQMQERLEQMVEELTLD